jgi:anti-sigma regulatory factor (Ser/Thr protein kinase)
VTEEFTTTERPQSTVCVEIPAEPRYVALIRVAAASMAADLDPVIDDVDDLRVAVNELVGLMVEAAEGGSVVVHLWSEERTIHVTGQCKGPSSRVSPDQLTLRILDATVDSYEVSDGSFRVHKRLGAV